MSLPSLLGWDILKHFRLELGLGHSPYRASLNENSPASPAITGSDFRCNSLLSTKVVESAREEAGVVGTEPRRATRQEAEAVDAVYQQVTALLNELQAARQQVDHPELLSVLDGLVNRQLGLEGELRAAIQRYCGHGYGGAEPY